MIRIRQIQDIRKLAKADQYFFELLSIPNLQERLDCMILRRKLDLDVADVRPELSIVRHAASELRHSAKFKRVLQVSSCWPSSSHHANRRFKQLVLAVGNALNASSFRGGAQGFKLDALLKVTAIKTYIDLQF